MTCYRLYGGRTPSRSSAGRLPEEERGQQSASVNTVTLSNLPPLRRRSCIYGARPDDQLHGGLRPLSPFGRARSGECGDLWSNATPVTRSNRRPTSSLGPVYGRTNGARPTYWALRASHQPTPAQHVLVFPPIDNWTTN